jgi:penicillin-binding protein-related factor A (putative recombinase)
MGAQPKTFVWRNRDKKDLMGLNKGRKVGTFPLPADYTVGSKGTLFFAEVKSTGDPKRFSYSQIEQGQRSAANISASIGTPYFFFIHSLKLGKWFVLTAQQFADDTKAGKKSRTFEELDVAHIQ